MRTIRRVLQLRHESSLTVREIARSTGLAPSTVGDYLAEAKRAGLGWPLPEELSEQELHARLRGERVPAKSAAEKPLPGWK